MKPHRIYDVDVSSSLTSIDIESDIASAKEIKELLKTALTAFKFENAQIGGRYAYWTRERGIFRTKYKHQFSLNLADDISPFYSDEIDSDENDY